MIFITKTCACIDIFVKISKNFLNENIDEDTLITRTTLTRFELVFCPGDQETLFEVCWMEDCWWLVGWGNKRSQLRWDVDGAGGNCLYVFIEGLKENNGQLLSSTHCLQPQTSFTEACLPEQVLIHRMWWLIKSQINRRMRRTFIRPQHFFP